MPKTARQIIAEVLGDVDEFTIARNKADVLSMVHKAMDCSEDGRLRLLVGGVTYSFDNVTDDGRIICTPTWTKEKIWSVYVVEIESTRGNDGQHEWVYAFVSQQDMIMAESDMKRAMRSDTVRYSHLKKAIRNRKWHLTEEYSGFKWHCENYIDELRGSEKLTLNLLSGKRWDRTRDSRLLSENGRFYYKWIYRIRKFAIEIGFDALEAMQIFDALKNTYTFEEVKEIIVKTKQGLPID